MNKDNSIHLLNQTVRLLNKKTNETLMEFGLFSSQWTILYCLDKKGQLSQTEISHYLNVERPTVTRTIRKLEENGWIIRTKGEDKRENLISLSEEALEKMPSIQNKIRTFENEQLGNLTDNEIDTLNALMKKIMKEV
ncbi:MarR family winged helix-turn-helix transcriptional regulator [Aciduricibacillus chroicocephali]|uniref:MarR family winged helix-turn-helix transcriptional regulator n=1 Tax=Aciduricibacillus chroicocephali TaxID=3054939 RepID=UPI003D65FAE9